MNRARIRILTAAIGFFVALGILLVQPTVHSQQSQQDDITITGKLSRVMAIGGESTGWSIHLDHPTTIEGKEVNSLEIDYAKTKKLEKLVDKEVKASGKIAHRHGVETGERLVFEISSIRDVKQN